MKKNFLFNYPLLFAASLALNIATSPTCANGFTTLQGALTVVVLCMTRVTKGSPPPQGIDALAKFDHHGLTTGSLTITDKMRKANRAGVDFYDDINNEIFHGALDGLVFDLSTTPLPTLSPSGHPTLFPVSQQRSEQTESPKPKKKRPASFWALVLLGSAGAIAYFYCWYKSLQNPSEEDNKHKANDNSLDDK